MNDAKSNSSGQWTTRSQVRGLCLALTRSVVDVEGEEERRRGQVARRNAEGRESMGDESKKLASCSGSHQETRVTCSFESATLKLTSPSHCAVASASLAPLLRQHEQPAVLSFRPSLPLPSLDVLWHVHLITDSPHTERAITSSAQTRTRRRPRARLRWTSARN